jgi:hypothetical protein
MIYRIRAALRRAENPNSLYKHFSEEDELAGPLQGAQRQLCFMMWALKLPLPRRRFRNRRARFWFTEEGWRRYGIPLMALAKKEADVVAHVICKKNPARSQIIYEDEIQVALLPDRDRKGKWGDE